MEWHLSSFFLNNEEAFIQLNPNILESNVQNLVILIGILIYANNVSFSVSLENRQKEIIQTIENAQKDVLKVFFPHAEIEGFQSMDDVMDALESGRYPQAVFFDATFVECGL